MGEHGFYFQHGDFIYEPLIRIPFILYCPGTIPATKIDSQIRASLDILPTILGFLKIEKPETLGGVDLLPSLAGKDAGFSPYVLSEDGDLCVRTDRWKLICPVKGRSPETYELFDLKNDPGETVNLVSIEKRKFAILKERMDEYRENFPLTKKKPPKLNVEAREALKALGYLQ